MLGMAKLRSIIFEVLNMQFSRSPSLATRDSAAAPSLATAPPPSSVLCFSCPARLRRRQEGGSQGQARSRQDHRSQADQGCREAEEERRHSQTKEDCGRRRRDQAQGAGEEGRGEAGEVPRGEAPCLVSDLKNCLRDGDPW